MTDRDLDEITAEGRIAGRTVAVLFGVTGLVAVAVSWDEMWARCGELAGECTSRSAGAVLVAAGSAVAVATGASIWLRVRRRRVDSYGSSRYVWALGLLFGLGMVFVASRVPAFTCARGRFDDLLELCMHPPTTSDPARWLPVKAAIIAVGVVGALVVVARPRWVHATAPLTAVAWLGGTGWTLAETMVLPG